MSRVLKAALAVCIVGIATESRAYSALRGTLRHWQLMPEVGTDYKEGDNLGGKSAEYSMNGIEKAIEVACELLRDEDPNAGQKRSIDEFVKSKKENEGHNKYNDGTPEAQNFVVMVVRLAGMITAHDHVKTCCKGYLEEAGINKWWQIPGVWNAKHDPIEDCRLYIKGFKLEEYFKDVKGTIYCMSGGSIKRSNLYTGGPEIDAVPGSSNFAAACQMMARYSLDGYMLSTLNELDALIAQNEGKQDAEAQDLIKQRAIVRISLITVAEIMYRADINVESKLLRRTTQDAISSEVITAEESPADIVERIAKIIMPFGHPLYDLFAQEVLENGGLKQARIRPERIVAQPQPGQEDQVRDVIPLIKCQNGMLAQLNKREEVDKNIDNKRPLMFGRAPIIKVKNVDLGSYLADGTGSRPESVIKTAMDSLYSNKIPQRFEWARNEWRERGNPIRSAAGQRAYYRLMSAIIRTKWGKTDEYLFVHWPYNNLNVFIRGRQWIDAFNAAIKAGEKPSLGEVCTLFYFRIS